MFKYTRAITLIGLLGLAACAPEIKIGDSLRVKSGFFKGCTGTARNFYDGLARDWVTIEPFRCNGELQAWESIETTNVEVIND